MDSVWRRLRHHPVGGAQTYQQTKRVWQKSFMRPQWVKCDKPWALMIHEWAKVDSSARVQADGPFLFRGDVPYCVTVFHEKVCRCGLFELLDINEASRRA